MNGFPHRPTLADVAEEARVSIVTVSRVVEGSDKVAASTRERVLATMERLGYFGNAAASQLVSGRATTIGIVTSNTSDYGYASTIRGIEESARDRDMTVLIAVIEGSDEKSVRKAVASVAAHALAGVVVIDFDSAAHAVLPALPAYLPVVSTASPPGSASHRPNVEADEYDGAVLAAEHLLELGHQSIFVLAPPDSGPAERRSLGTLDTLTRARLPHYPIVRCADWQPRSGYEGASKTLVEYGDRVTAIACANDEIALGAIRAIGDHGLRVPEDVSVMGFDDHPLAAFATPALTTMHQDFVTLGRYAFALLDATIAGRELPTERKVLPRLVVRESTARPSATRGLGRA
jgi:DNA-binding LacI/PurR family transcriptional regulator